MSVLHAGIVYQPTPVQDISADPLLVRAGVRILIKREDMNHPEISGNKWWKLKYNIEEAIRQGHKTVLTFGGAYSNHIYATAAAARAANLTCIGIIRGEETLPLNPTLRFAKDCGMKIDYVGRQTYKEKESPSFIGTLRNKWGDFYLIPEGGTNDLAVKGCEEFGRIIDEIPADYICLPVGTGGTMAGVLRGISIQKKVLGFTVMKDGAFLQPVIEMHAGGKHDNWELITEYSYGGYGSRDERVATFIRQFMQRTGIPLDFVYTGKMMCAIFDLIDQGYFAGKTILAIHTGGLQGHSEYGRAVTP